MIRMIAPEDVGALTELEQSGFPDRERWSARTWSAEIVASGRFGYVWMDKNGRVMAGALFQAVSEVSELHRIVVARQHRLRGVASKLMAKGIHHAKLAGANRMLLEVRDSNDGAICLYENLGFSQIATRENYYSIGVKALVMELNLVNYDTSGGASGE